MRLKIEIKLEGVGDPSVDDGPRETIATLVGLSCIVRVLREEPEVMAFGHDNEGDLGVDVECLACLSDDVEF